ncbi:LysR family transcriptional regulator [Segnochrobactrum spirostomi]|uniref:LysR family transcriptional regulator n=1 Tax=Segnochrobactrum spirostomi TaxID=2608987 RepID=A0A6A7XZI8_9HYPH|nr:LysR family transcriptional regulator [Segnochrobactrum spirostomi]MQT11321.1 LysR family transcriptional regulator [Segnochrobactrum spirostomi]
MDWDKLRIFHAAAQAGSFTHAGDMLNMSQSAVSRQVSALEQELGIPLFHRHARGLLLTEQGDLLFRTARDVMMKLDAVQARLADSREKPSGVLRVTTTVGLGTTWLTSRINEFLEIYPDVELQVILDDTELDLSMRQADVAIRLRQPVQPDLIQRRLFTVHFHLYASPAYLRRFGSPSSVAELDQHRLITFGEQGASYLREMNWAETAGRAADQSRRPTLKINSVVAIKQAVQRGIGIGLLPDYIIEPDSGLVQLIPEAELPEYNTYFVYPAELKSTARVRAFRDFIVAKAEEWTH